jgi:hypothetical protein
MDYSTTLTLMKKGTNLPKNIIDEILVFVYMDADAIMWYLVESERIFSETALRNYNLFLLNGVLKLYQSCHKNVIHNIQKNVSLVMMLEQQAIPMYADICMLKGKQTYTRLQNEQIRIGECRCLKIVFPLKTLISTIAAIEQENK